jgi:hypothetical protein
MRVFNESIFISLEKCFCTVFDCTCALAHQSLVIRRDLRALLYLPRLALCAEKFQESTGSLCTLFNLIYVHYVPKRNGHVCNKYLTLISTRPRLAIVEHALCKIKISPFIVDHLRSYCHLVNFDWTTGIRAIQHIFASSFFPRSCLVVSTPTTDPVTQVRYPAGITFSFFLSCTIFYGLFIALGLHLDSTTFFFTYWFNLQIYIYISFIVRFSYSMWVS